MEKELTNLHLSELNSNQSQSLIMLEQIRSHLIAVIGHELWNPLSTIQVCLESLANELAMQPEAKQVIITTAVEDVKYLHQLIDNCMAFSEVKPATSNRVSSPPELTKTSQEVLHQTIFGILQSKVVRTKSDSFSEIVSYSVKQKEILEHIRNNLIAIVGHEIRTPLCTIEICLESLSNDLQMSSECRQQMLDIALNDLARLQKLIKDFFILDRLEKGQVYYRSRKVRLREVIDLALAGLKPDRENQLVNKIVVEIPQQLPLIKVDEDILVQALIELLDNACKFTQPPGEIKIEAQVTRDRSDSNLAQNTNITMLEIVISDNGRGIVPHHLEAIFNCFYQEENFLRRTVGGTGIGLTICRHLINALGGKIWANSAGKGCGSSIHFTLPVAV